MKVQKLNNGFIYLLQPESSGGWGDLLGAIGGFAEHHGLAADGFTGALLARESHYPTGLKAAVGVAIPHADQLYTVRESLIVAVLTKPVMFRQMGGGAAEVPVEIVFTLLLDDPERHLDLLGAVSGFIQDRDKVAQLQRGESMMALLTDSFGPVPAG